MNSIRNVKRAIDIEVKRQIDIYESAGTIDQETRSFNQADGTSFPLRSKENAHDYRYFPEPDLPPVIVTQNTIEAIKAQMPKLPKELFEKFTAEQKLSAYDAKVISDDKETANYYIELIKYTNNYKAAANWLINDVKSYTNENNIQLSSFHIKPSKIAEIILLVDENKISSSGAKSIFQQFIQTPEKSALQIAEEQNLIQSSNNDELSNWAAQAIAQMPDKVTEYQKGKKGNLNLFIGIVMKLSKGKADPKLTTKILEELLSK
jgi:aspartyl-tRNA(Asn)/glutamyl-tRNA(Gln) amidotransferase subunit B